MLQDTKDDDIVYSIAKLYLQKIYVSEERISDILQNTAFLNARVGLYKIISKIAPKFHYASLYEKYYTANALTISEIQSTFQQCVNYIIGQTALLSRTKFCSFTKVDYEKKTTRQQVKAVQDGMKCVVSFTAENKLYIWDDYITNALAFSAKTHEKSRVISFLDMLGYISSNIVLSITIISLLLVIGLLMMPALACVMLCLLFTHIAYQVLISKVTTRLFKIFLTPFILLLDLIGLIIAISLNKTQVYNSVIKQFWSQEVIYKVPSIEKDELFEIINMYKISQNHSKY